MATKSVLKSIEIRDKKTAQALISALENAKGKHAKPVEHQRAFSDATRDEVRKIFGIDK